MGVRGCGGRVVRGSRAGGVVKKSLGVEEAKSMRADDDGGARSGLPSPPKAKQIAGSTKND